MVEIMLESDAEAKSLGQLSEVFLFEVKQDRVRIPSFSDAVAIRNEMVGSSVGVRLHEAIREQLGMRISVDHDAALERALISGR